VLHLLAVPLKLLLVVLLLLLLRACPLHSQRHPAAASLLGPACQTDRLPCCPHHMSVLLGRTAQGTCKPAQRCNEQVV
jgi:hypothetical protein